MSDTASTVFDDLYNFQTESGIVMPQTSTVKTSVEEAFKTIFGNDISTDPSTPIGRFIEALTLLFINVLGVNAQNANGFNIETAAGTYLDALGSLFSIPRSQNESDAKYREVITSSQSRGSGYVKSIRNAVMNVADVKAASIFENGHSYPVALPNTEFGIAIHPHSVYVCVSGGENQDIANAIYKAKSAGCGYTDIATLGDDVLAEYGIIESKETNSETNKTTVVYKPVNVTNNEGIYSSTEYGERVEITETVDSNANTVIFYRPTERTISISVTVSRAFYTGTNIADDTKAIMIEFLAGFRMGCKITSTMVASAVAAGGKNIVVIRCSFSEQGGEAKDEINILPGQVAIVGESNISVNVLEQ